MCGSTAWCEPCLSEEVPFAQQKPAWDLSSHLSEGKGVKRPLLFSRTDLGKALSSTKGIGVFSRGCPCLWVNPWDLFQLFYSAHCTGWQSLSGDVQELPAKEVLSSSALTSGANRKLFLGHSDMEQYHFQPLLALPG